MTNKNCLYCSKKAKHIDREGVCTKCHKINDEVVVNNNRECNECGSSIYRDEYNNIEGNIFCYGCSGSCSDCGDNHNNSNLYYCDNCGDNYCDGCSNMEDCIDCSSPTCARCREFCDKCELYVCSGCDTKHKNKCEAGSEAEKCEVKNGSKTNKPNKA